MCPEKILEQYISDGLVPDFDFKNRAKIFTNQMNGRFLAPVPNLTLFTKWSIFHHFSWLMSLPKTPWRINFELLEYLQCLNQKSIRQSEKLRPKLPGINSGKSCQGISVNTLTINFLWSGFSNKKIIFRQKLRDSNYSIFPGNTPYGPYHSYSRFDPQITCHDLKK